MTMLGIEEDLSHPFDLTSICTAQLNDKGLMLIVRIFVARSGPDNTIYTHTSILKVLNSFTRITEC